MQEPHAQESHAQEPQRATSKPTKRRYSRAIIAVAIAVVLVLLIQSFATQTDHQLANFASFAIAVISSIYAIAQFHFAAMGRGYRYLVPSIVAACLVTISALIRFDGFSGEMVPQFVSRYREPPPLPSVSSTELSNAEKGAAEASALRDSDGFLGSQRTGVSDTRDFAIPRSSGDVATLWSQAIGDGWSSFAVSADRAVTIEQRDELECVTCYRLLDGELLWMVTHEAHHENPLGGVGPRSTPTIDSGRVYAQGATGLLMCLDLESGDEVWSADLLELGGWDQNESEASIPWGRAGSPLLVDGLCVLPLGAPESNADSGRSLIAFDADDGETVWTAGQQQISYASPMLMEFGDTRQIVSVNEATVTGHAIADGNVLWEFDWDGQSNAGANCASAVPAGKDRFLVGKGYGGGSSLVNVARQDERWTAQAVWTSPSLLKTKFTHAVVDEGIAYGISNGSLEAVELESTKLLWRQPRSDRFGQGHVVLAGDTLIGQSENGDVVFVTANPDAYRENLRIPALRTKTWNIPTIAGRHLLVRNDRQAICYYLGAK